MRERETRPKETTAERRDRGDRVLENQEEVVIPVVAEELKIGREKIETGGVQIHKRVHEHQETVDIPLVKEDVEVRRVVINREVDVPPLTRYEGDTTIIPLVEEVLVVEKRLVLKEEIHVTRRRSEVHEQQQVTLRNEEAEVHRLDEQGRPVSTEPRRS